jgi:hypothetical protein
MEIEVFGKLHVAIMSIYFMLSGLNALFDIDAKLARIGLTANVLDSKVAFILIYCSLMIGVGIVIMSKSWIYSAVLTMTIICSFIIFRLIGSFIVGKMTNVQLSFILVEVIEAGIGIFLLLELKQAGRLAQSS